MATNELSRLKAELALALEKGNTLEARLAALTIQPTETKSPCYFLEKIPIEIRNQIYAELLVNPILGTCASVCVRGWGLVDYNLSTSILSTCRQIHHEASEILYGRNTFFMLCMRESGKSSQNSITDMSPITRKWED
jgi:hypothetical protein